MALDALELAPGLEQPWQGQNGFYLAFSLLTPIEMGPWGDLRDGRRSTQRRSYLGFQNLWLNPFLPSLLQNR